MLDRLQPQAAADHLTAHAVDAWPPAAELDDGESCARQQQLRSKQAATGQDACDGTEPIEQGYS